MFHLLNHAGQSQNVSLRMSGCPTHTELGGVCAHPLRDQPLHFLDFLDLLPGFVCAQPGTLINLLGDTTVQTIFFNKIKDIQQLDQILLN